MLESGVLASTYRPISSRTQLIDALIESCAPRSENGSPMWTAAGIRSGFKKRKNC